jgi:hypothetical protein
MQFQTSICTVDSPTRQAAAELEETVKGRLCGRVTAFQLVVEGQGLVLRGRTRSYYLKQLAQQTVMEITRLPILANYIEVTGGEPS